MAYIHQANTYNQVSQAWGVMDVNFMSNVMKQARNPENWAENTESRQYAEIYTNESTIGIRRSGTVDVIMDLPVIGGPLRGFASILGANPYTDVKQIESGSDYRRYDKESEVDNTFGGDPFLENMAANELINNFNFMRSQYNSGTVDLSTKFMRDKDDLYRLMMDDGENYELNDYFWDKYNSYEYGLFN